MLLEISLVEYINKKVNTQFETNEKTMKEKIKNVLDSVKSKAKTISDKLKRSFAVKVWCYSMSGKIEHGDIVRARKVWRLTRYNIGDIIVFKVGNVKVIHEIVGITTDGQYKTKGFNNEQEDPWTVSKKDIVGKVDISRADLAELLLRVEQGKITLEVALGMSATTVKTRSEISTKMLEILENIYGEEKTLEEIKNYLCGDISKEHFKGIEDFRPLGQKEFSSQTLNALIYILDRFIAHEDSKSVKDSYKTFKSEIIVYAAVKGIEIQGIDPYHKDWKKLYPEHCYILILETLGLNVWSLVEFLDDKRMSEWIRHHIDEDKGSIETWKLALVYNLENLNDIPHLYMVGWMKDGRRITEREVMKVRQDLFGLRETLLNLIKMDGNLEFEDAKKYFPAGTNEDIIQEFLDRRDFLKNYGEEEFFKQYYGDFYKIYQKKLFWNTHYLNTIGII